MSVNDEDGMNQMPAQRVTYDGQMGRRIRSGTTVSGGWLWLARAGWLAVFLLVLSMFAASLPTAVRDIYSYEWQVTQARPAASTFFATYASFANYIFGLRLSAVVVFWATAVFIAWRKADDWLVLYVSATLLMMSYLFAFQSDVSRWRFPDGLVGVLPAIEWAAPTLFAVCFFLLFYLFPDGRFTPRWIVWAGVGGTGAALLFFAGLEGMLGIPEGWAWPLFGTSVMVVAFVGLGSQAVKWRQASLVQKQQTRLVLAALAAFAWIPLTGLFFSAWSDAAAWGHFVSLHLGLIGATLIPLAIGVSVLRYRLWQMELLLNRTLVYGGLTAVILLLYLAVVSGLGALLRSSGDGLLAVLATGLVAVLFNPLRQRLQTAANQLIYGQQHDPMAVMAELGRQLEGAVVPGETLPNLVRTIGQTLKLPYVAINVREGDEMVTAAVYPGGNEFAGRKASYPLTHQSELVGQLLVGFRSEGESFGDSEDKLLRNVARQASTAVYAAQVTRELQRSRQQLVAAREEERRRLRRDLHDGVGPQLAALAVKVDAAVNLLQADPEKARVLLAEIKAESHRAVQEIRRTVDGLRPAALDQLGLVSALREFGAQHSRSSTQIELAAPELMPPLPAAAEVAAYRIATEAVTNCLRHAGAQNCMIRLEVGEKLRIWIEDDGAGMPADWRPGVGLASMRERAVELGGRFSIESSAGGGTRVEASLPIGDQS